MPTISIFYGIVIQMFFDEHAPPHFHVKYAEFKAVIDINLLKLVEGKLPRRALEFVLEWAQQYQTELLEDRKLCQSNQCPKKIAPLT